MSATPPDSGEREVCPHGFKPPCPENYPCTGPHEDECTGREDARHDYRAVCLACGRVLDAVPVPLPLAQRILAALELTARFVDSNAMSLADELRKEMGK